MGVSFLFQLSNMRTSLQKHGSLSWLQLGSDGVHFMGAALASFSLDPGNDSLPEADAVHKANAAAENIPDIQAADQEGPIRGGTDVVEHVVQQRSSGASEEEKSQDDQVAEPMKKQQEEDARPRQEISEQQLVEEPSNERQEGSAAEDTGSFSSSSPEEEQRQVKPGELERLFNSMELFSPYDYLEKYMQRMRDHPVWVAYRSLNQKIISGQAPKRYLIYRSVGGQGFGNLFAGVELAFYIAVASGRALLLDWDSHTLEKVFEPRDIDWRISNAQKAIISLGSKKSRDVSFLNYAKPELDHRKLLRLARSELPVMGLRTNSGVQGWEQVLSFGEKGIWNITLKEWVRPWYRLRGFVFHALFKLSKKGDFGDLWRRMNKSIPPGPRIGIHIRVGDVSWKAGDGDRRPVIYAKRWGLKDVRVAANQSLHCAQELARQLGFQEPCAIIFESDNNEAKKFARKAGKISGGPCTAWASPLESRHSAMGGGNTMQTWLSLLIISVVEILLITTGTFGFAAGMVGPGMAGYPRMVKFEDFLIKRSNMNLPISSMQNMCHLSRQPRNARQRQQRLDIFLGKEYTGEPVRDR
mmetsp:Transcript_155299/g.286130  ORF Transcript_155299/g.286130 Transcript_155299/m.286130 type:complete len:583 (-) Transcript_155299:26-1774(-)